MRTLAWVLLLACSVSPCLASSPDNVGERTVAFVGKLVSIRELPDPCEGEPEPTDGTLGCISMDEGYEATYEIDEVLMGHASSKTVTFYVADHYGFPRFAQYNHALLFVAQDKEGWYLHKYQGFPVFATADAGWATCGVADGTKEWSASVRPLAFLAALRSVGESSEAGIDATFDGWPVEVSGGEVRCTAGIPVRELYELVRTGVMAARKVSLPKL
jgi:hypothetical protein